MDELRRASGVSTLLLDDDAIFGLRPDMVVELPDGRRWIVAHPPQVSVVLRGERGERLRIDASAGGRLVERVSDV
jgi:hypothetical protein